MKHWKLKYSKAATTWTEALPLGNGTIGAMIYGGDKDKVSLNLSTLWSGNGSTKENPTDKIEWDTIRQYIFEEKYKEAEDMIRMQALGNWTEAYLPAANLYIEMEKENNDEYYRELNLTEAIYREERKDKYSKEAFVDYEKNVFVLCLMSKGENKLSFSTYLDSSLKHDIVIGGRQDYILLNGKAPAYVAPDYYQCEDPIRYSEEGMEFSMGLRVKVIGGEIKNKGNKLEILGAEKALFYVTGKTNFSGGEEPVLLQDLKLRYYIEKTLDGVYGLEYEPMISNNIVRYQSYFGRMELQLGEDIGEYRDTDVRVKAFQKDGNDIDFMTLMFHYGRYLLISSSALDGECANLQGIWNEKVRAPWSSNYTVNINTEMNYWPVESCNLGELHTPMFNLMKRTAKRGAITAKKLYGAEGWVSHHNIDIWGHSTPVGYYANNGNPCVYSMWNMSSGWMCRHLWEHYCYTLDKEFLEKEAYPLIEGAVSFYLDILQLKDGVLVTIPSTSPENMFLDKNGEEHAVTMASTMDIAILKEIFGYYLEICSVLGEKKNADRCREALKKLPSYQIGKYGQLQEWYIDYEEADVNHRHVSHLYGLYPSNTIKGEDTELREACKTALLRRGNEGTGWCIAWKAALWARLGEGEKVFELLNNQLRFTDCEYISMNGGGTYANLFCAHPPFQIDGNFGYMAAVIEAIIQSQDEKIVLLPAIPEKWSKGYVKGIRARGGYTIDFVWDNSLVKEISITATVPGSITLCYNGKTEEVVFDNDKRSVCI